MPKHKDSSKGHSRPPASAASLPSNMRFATAAKVAAIVLAVFIVYMPSLNGWFILDDDLLLTGNPLIRSSDGICRFWCTTQAADYWPVSNTSLWIEWRLWGMNPTGYHVFSVTLHVAESLLIWVIWASWAFPELFSPRLFSPCIR